MWQLHYKTSKSPQVRFRYTILYFLLTVRDVKVRQIPPKPLSDRARKMSAERTRTKGTTIITQLKQLFGQLKNVTMSWMTQIANLMCPLYRVAYV